MTTNACGCHGCARLPQNCKHPMHTALLGLQQPAEVLLRRSLLRTCSPCRAVSSRRPGAAGAEVLEPHPQASQSRQASSRTHRTGPHKTAATSQQPGQSGDVTCCCQQHPCGPAWASVVRFGKGASCKCGANMSSLWWSTWPAQACLQAQATNLWAASCLQLAPLLALPASLPCWSCSRELSS